MRDRLIELLNDSFAEQYEKRYLLTAQHTADHLIAAGVIVPPCKVGDKLYAISENRIKECTCYEFMMHTELTICAEFNCDYDCKGCPFSHWAQDYSGEYSCHGEYGEHFFSLGDFGKTVFLTREEAEKALAERREG